MQRLLMDRRYNTAADILAHVREQAALAVWRANAGHDYTNAQFKEAVDRVYHAMIEKLTADLTAQGHADLAAKLTAAAPEA